MKNIELTEKHKSKLLEMCKELFTEYDFRINKPLFCNNESLSTIQLGNKNVNIYENEIHWFEFCMTHLGRKLLTFNDLIKYQTTGNFLYVHIIDYLYEEFKKLK